MCKSRGGGFGLNIRDEREMTERQLKPVSSSLGFQLRNFYPVLEAKGSPAGGEGRERKYDLNGALEKLPDSSMYSVCVYKWPQ